MQLTDPRPAHRPSRRDEIISAAVRVFANAGYSVASIQDVADEAGVVQTAVYYHFSGKEELFNVALQRTLDRISEQAIRAGGDDPVPGREGLSRTIRAVWTWLDEHPDEARLYALHSVGATSTTAWRREALDEKHLQRAYSYFTEDAPPPSRTAAKVRHAQQTLALRVVLTILPNAHALRLNGSALNSISSAAACREVEEVCARVLMLTE